MRRLRWRWFLLVIPTVASGGNSFLGPNGLPMPGQDGCHDSVQVEDRERTVGVLKTKGGGLCTGTLISPHVVLTAAHCVKKGSADDAKFTLANDPEVVGAAFAPISRIVFHPDFSKLGTASNQGVDLALLQLETTNYGAAPKGYFSVGNAGEEVLGTPATIIGYGTGTHDTTIFRRKKSLVLQRTNSSNMLRVSDGPNGERPCPGDSGAPVIKYAQGRQRIVGVFSYSRERVVPLSMAGGVKTAGGTASYICRAAEGQFATWMDAYRDWIETNRQALESDKRFQSCP